MDEVSELKVVRLALRGNCPACKIIDELGLGLGLGVVDTEGEAAKGNEEEEEEDDVGKWCDEFAMVVVAAWAAAATEAGRWPEERLGLEVRENPGRSC